jgi:HPt (histidine-containing phosphotransfer) domain-containing protein
MNFKPTDHEALNDEMIASLRALGEGDPDPNAFLKDLIATYMRTTPEIFSGLLASLDSGDLKQIIFFSHKLKGQSNNVGLSRLSALCEEIESSEGKLGPADEVKKYRAAVETQYAEACKILRELK